MMDIQEIFDAISDYGFEAYDDGYKDGLAKMREMQEPAQLHHDDVMSWCSRCGAINSIMNNFCPKCGARFVDITRAEKDGE